MTSPTTITQTQTQTSSHTDEDLNALLQRLSQKQSVQSVLILDRKDGSIIRATGSMARPVELGRNSDEATEYAGLVWKWVKASEELVGELGRVDEAVSTTGSAGVDGVVERGGAEKKEGREEEDLRLLRLRTKRRELVIVPDPKYILIVFHDTPPA